MGTRATTRAPSREAMIATLARVREVIATEGGVPWSDEFIATEIELINNVIGLPPPGTAAASSRRR